MEVEMLTEQCEELINKLSNFPAMNSLLMDEPSEQEEIISEDTKKEK